MVRSEGIWWSAVERGVIGRRVIFEWVEMGYGMVMYSIRGKGGGTHDGIGAPLPSQWQLFCDFHVVRVNEVG